MPDNVAQTSEPPHARDRHALLAAWNRKLAPQPDHLLLLPSNFSSFPDADPPRAGIFELGNLTRDLASLTNDFLTEILE